MYIFYESSALDVDSSTLKWLVNLVIYISYLNYNLRLPKGWSVLGKNKMNKPKSSSFTFDNKIKVLNYNLKTMHKRWKVYLEVGFHVHNLINYKFNYFFRKYLTRFMNILKYVYKWNPFFKIMVWVREMWDIYIRNQMQQMEKNVTITQFSE